MEILGTSLNFRLFLWKRLSYLFSSKYPQDIPFLQQPLQCITLNRGWMSRFTCNTGAPFLTQLLNTVIYCLQSCFWNYKTVLVIKLQWWLQLMQHRMKWTIRIQESKNSSASKIPKGKTLDSDPYLHAMSIQHAKEVFAFECWLSLESITFESLWLNGGLS